MSENVLFRNKNHRVGIAENGASIDWEPGEVLELPRAEAVHSFARAQRT